MSKKILFTVAMLVIASLATFACTTCDPVLQRAIYNSTFYPNLLTMLSAFIILGLLVIVLAAISTRRHRRFVAAYPDVVVLEAAPLTTAAMVLGIGLGGFIDGLVFHQLLQWHEMLSSKIPVTTLTGKSVNMFWDGIFHAFCWIVSFIGVLLLWRLSFRAGINRSGKLLTGGLLTGWGLFNLVEGIINHHILVLHNVREVTTNSMGWNVGFLVVSCILILIGYAFIDTHSRIYRRRALATWRTSNHPNTPDETDNRTAAMNSQI